MDSHVNKCNDLISSYTFGESRASHMLLYDWPLTEPIPLGALTLHRLHPLEGQKKCPA